MTFRIGLLDLVKGIAGMKITVDIGEIELDAVALKKVTKLVNELRGEIMANQEKVDIALAKLDETTTKIAEIVQSVVAADDAEDAAFRAEIDALKAQIAAGDAVSQEQLDALAAGLTSRSEKLNDVADALAAIGANPAEPVPDVEIEPEPEPTPAVEG